VDDSETAAALRERAWLVAAGVLVAAAAIARVHNAFAFPSLHDYDGPGHALNVFALYEGRLPDPRSWSGFHPPLAYAIGAALWHVLPSGVPVHAALRLLSAAAGFGAVAIAWRALRRFFAAADAAVVAAFVLCAPVVAIATSMLGNETLCALFATAALARLLAIPSDPRALRRHGAITMGLAALAALTKSTGLGVVAVVGLAYLWRLRRAGAAALTSTALVLGAIALVALAPHYGKLIWQGGSPLAVVSGGVAGAAVGEMAQQPPGVRHVSDYLSLPVAMFFAPFKDAPAMVESVPGLLYATLWADGQGEFLPVADRNVVTAASVAALLGLVPTVVAAIGFARIRRRPAWRDAMGGPLLFGALLFAALLVQTWVVPRFSAVKASYLLSALLPATLALGAGVATTRPRVRAALRCVLLAIGAYATFLTWYGWWL
jgi:hypothetical protein